MLTASFRRKTLLILLVTVLATPVLSFGGPRAESPRLSQTAESASPDFFDRVWNFLRKVGSKEGCNIDPSGCTSQNPRPRTKAGCEIDPSGRCLP
jgi:hypothetical protein